uniref:Basement membrane-specific heparan sulfate proteoglycan core protein n=1 Tax=Romanomermis culicivorax TaxID=13658 RepID=A0A915HKJ2_ROMCU
MYIFTCFIREASHYLEMVFSNSFLHRLINFSFVKKYVYILFFQLIWLVVVMNMYFCLFFTFLPLCYGRGSINARFGDAPYDTRHFRAFREDAARCGPEEATCNNGECVRRSSICDGEYDCRDRSDEINCGPQKQCEPNEFVCANRRCVQKMWVCDNEDDCGDNSDEMNCATRAPGELCSPSEYKCSRNDQCIPKSYQCDGQNDCQDGSDEFGCWLCIYDFDGYSACLGETLVLNCRAVGVPTPHITWRLNWGPVCDPPRCTQTSVDGYGVLTITSIQESDQGAYSCEAINTRKRILAVPDTIVTVRRCNDTNAEQTSICNRDGTIRDLPDGRCQCKPYVTGPHCDQCADFCFNLYHRNPHGCIRCFCMGVTRQCDSSGYYRSQERLSFRGDSQGVTVCSADERQTDPHVRFDYDVVPNAITIRPPRLTGVVYWSLPKSFLGNKLTSYGGKLKFAVQYSGYESPVQEPLVILRGNEITLVHRNRLSLVPDRLNPIEVDIYETSFTREDGQQATHEHLLMTLANLESLLIRETHSQSQTSSSLGEISLDVAVQSYTSQNRADAVEKCACPEGYVGLSCEECAPGYQRSGGGLYLGTCSPDDNGYQDVTTTTRRPIHHAQCDPSGSLSDRPDPRTGACHCKEHVWLDVMD